VEILSIFAADRTVCAIRRHNQISRRIWRIVANFRLELQFNAQFGTAILQDVQQVYAPDARKPVPRRGDCLTLEVNINIVPVIETWVYLIMLFESSSAKVFEVLVRKDTAPAKSGIRAVALDYGDLMARIGLFHQQGKI